MHVLLFSIDILPHGARVQTSGGSLRSQQFVSRFDANGFRVTKAVPSGSLLVKTQRHLLGGADLLFFDAGNQAEIIAEVKPDVIVWAWPLVAQVPIRPHPRITSIVDLNGFQNIESATATGGDVKEVTNSLLSRARQADMVVYGSPEQRAYWEGLFKLAYRSEPLPRGFVLPFYDPPYTKRPYATDGLDFYYVGSFLPWLKPFKGLNILADELPGTSARLRVFASTQPTGGDPTLRKDLKALAERPGVVLEKPLPYERLYEEIGYRGVAFDLLEESFERRFAYPIRTVSYLTYGIPVLHNDYSSLSQALAQSGAGWAAPDDEAKLRDTIRSVLREAPERRAERSRAATQLADQTFACDPSWAAFSAALVERAASRGRVTGRAAGGAVTGGAPAGGVPKAGARRPNILVISDDEDNILNLRLVTPLDALLRGNLIGGYAVVGHGGLRRSTWPAGEDAAIHSVVVQRVPRVPSVVVNECTGGRFTYDIDDNLLAQPSYRPSFPADFAWKARTYLHNASCVSVTNPILARSLAALSGIDVAGKARIVPNTLVRRRRDWDDGAIRRVMFASSDELPLTASAASVFSAIGSFCRRHALPFLYMGPYPNNPVFGTYLGGVAIQPVEPRPYRDYLALLEDSSALAVVPLETGGDWQTAEFVRAKSDIKAVEYLGMGCPAVFSAAAPYAASDLPITHLVPNEEEAWTAALEAALQSRLEDRRAAAAEVEAKRWIGGPIQDLWLDYLEQNRLDAPLRLRRVLDTIEASISRLRFSAVPAETFDAAYYLGRNGDVRAAVESGAFSSAYEHYVARGHAEGRAASVFDTGRSMVDHIEQTVATLVGLDGELNGTDQTIAQLKRKFGID